MIMGLPRPYADEIADEVTMLSNTSLGTSPQFARISSCDYDELPKRQSEEGGSAKAITYVSSCARGLSCTANADSGRKNVSHFPKCSHTPFKSKLAGDITATMHGKRTGLDEKHSHCVSKVGQGISNPASRVVGFESPANLPSHDAQRMTCESFQTYSPICNLEDRRDLPVMQIRKRTLSPLNDMFSPGQCDTLSEYLEIRGGNLLGSSEMEIAGEPNDEYCRFDVHDYKKANSGNCPTSTALPIPRHHMWEHHSSRGGNVECSVIHTDGPLFNGTQPMLHDHHFLSIGQKHLHKQSNEKRPEGRATVTKYSSSPNQGVSPLSLSPLGPRWGDRMKVTCLGKADNGIAVADVHSSRPRYVNSVQEESDRNNTSIMEDEIGIARESFQDFRIFYKDLVSSSPYKSAGGGLRWGFESASAPQAGTKIARSLSGLPTRRSLVGSFEESLLSGRFSSGKASQRIEGFLAVLNVTGGSFSPPVRKLPFSVTCVDGDSSLLYYASVDLAGNCPPNKSRGTRSKKNGDSRAAKSRFRIPMKGRIQLVLSNPEMTPVHTFMCNYDLSDMPPGTKTFMRHKVTLASSGLSAASTREGSCLPRNFDFIKGCAAPSLGLVKNECVLFNGRPHDSDGVEEVCSMKSGKLNSSNLKDEISGSRACTYAEDPVQCDICKQPSDLVNSVSFESNNILQTTEVVNFTVNKQIVNSDLNHSHDQGIRKEDSGPMDICNRPRKNTVHNSVKVNENTSSGGALRYALHLRFLCPPLKKGSNVSLTCNSDSLPSAVLDNSSEVEDERRFYLYNDLRVVFPQRHSDADEGKLQVEYHFPADPKYFEYSNW